MALAQTDQSFVETTRPLGASEVVLACEHASAAIPESLQGLGLSDEARFSHVAWDPGARAVALGISARLDAPLVASTVSRLVYDCNRPPGAEDAMPAVSEAFAVPGNIGLSQAERAARAGLYYEPFRKALAVQMARQTAPVLVTIHSFTPVYNGVERDVEIGILHDADSRLADAFLATASALTTHDVRRNVPYGPDDGVTHTLKAHALDAGHLNVMIEVRNDLIADAPAQEAMARLLSDWTLAAIAHHQGGRRPCRA